MTSVGRASGPDSEEVRVGGAGLDRWRVPSSRTFSPVMGRAHHYREGAHISVPTPPSVHGAALIPSLGRRPPPYTGTPGTGTPSGEWGDATTPRKQLCSFPGPGC